MSGMPADTGSTTGAPAPEMPLPRRLDARAAFRVYVAGRNRGLPLEEKAALAEPRADAGGPTAAGESNPRTPAPATATVPIPHRLTFHRNAGLWRESLASRTAGRPE